MNGESSTPMGAPGSPLELTGTSANIACDQSHNANPRLYDDDSTTCIISPSSPAVYGRMGSPLDSNNWVLRTSVRSLSGELLHRKDDDTCDLQLRTHNGHFFFELVSLASTRAQAIVNVFGDTVYTAPPQPSTYTYQNWNVDLHDYIRHNEFNNETKIMCLFWLRSIAENRATESPFLILTAWDAARSRMLWILIRRVAIIRPEERKHLADLSMTQANDLVSGLHVRLSIEVAATKRLL